jgi:hypothetical protein
MQCVLTLKISYLLQEQDLWSAPDARPRLKSGRQLENHRLYECDAKLYLSRLAYKSLLPNNCFLPVNILCLHRHSRCDF